jgi:hypothetical protein
LKLLLDKSLIFQQLQYDDSGLLMCAEAKQKKEKLMTYITTVLSMQQMFFKLKCYRSGVDAR